MYSCATSITHNSFLDFCTQDIPLSFGLWWIDVHIFIKYWFGIWDIPLLTLDKMKSIDDTSLSLKLNTCIKFWKLIFISDISDIVNILEPQSFHTETCNSRWPIYWFLRFILKLIKEILNQSIKKSFDKFVCLNFHQCDLLFSLSRQNYWYMYLSETLLSVQCT